MDQEEGEERGVSWLIVGGGGRQVRHKVGKSRVSGSKSKGELCGWTLTLGEGLAYAFGERERE